MRAASIIGGILCAAVASAAQAQMRITEYMYQGTSGGGEFVEFTNVGLASIDMSGWSYDDVDDDPGTIDLSAFGVVLPGESVILSEIAPATFKTRWGGLPGVDVVGPFTTDNLGRNDTIHLYDNFGTTIDTLQYGDQDFSGSIRTNGVSGWVSAAGLGANNPFAYTLSSVGDFQNSVASSGGEIGSPGRHIIPEPATVGLLALGLIAARRTTRR